MVQVKENAMNISTTAPAWLPIIPPEHITFSDFYKILDDATCHGFEFKVQDGKYFYREICL